MNGCRAGTRRYSKESSVAYSYKGQEIGESYVHPHPEGTCHINNDDDLWYGCSCSFIMLKAKTKIRWFGYMKLKCKILAILFTCFNEVTAMYSDPIFMQLLL